MYMYMVLPYKLYMQYSKFQNLSMKLVGDKDTFKTIILYPFYLHHHAVVMQ